MSLKNTPPPFTVVHGRNDCDSRYLALAKVPSSSWMFSVMVLEMGVVDTVYMKRYVDSKGSDIGTVYEGVMTYNFSHRESNCPNRKRR